MLLPPARGRSIGRNRADRALGRCPQGPAAASNWGKFEANKWGDSLPARDLHRQRALFARHGGKCRAQALSRILCGKAESGGRHQTILGRLPQRATGAIRYGGELSCRASLQHPLRWGKIRNFDLPGNPLVSRWSRAESGLPRSKLSCSAVVNWRSGQVPGDACATPLVPRNLHGI